LEKVLIQAKEHSISSLSDVTRRTASVDKARTYVICFQWRRIRLQAGAIVVPDAGGEARNARLRRRRRPEIMMAYN